MCPCARACERACVSAFEARESGGEGEEIGRRQRERGGEEEGESLR